MGKRRGRAHDPVGETSPPPAEGGSGDHGTAGIAIKAKADPKCRFTSLAHILTPGFLKETWQQMNRRGASGVDGETCAEFERDLETRVVDLWERLKAGRYQAPPVRRVDIPKPGDPSGTRPLGIPTAEDRLLQRAVARILSAIYEQDFMECSYGYRPGRNPHQALRVLRSRLMAGKVQYVYETDIRGYFTRINHDWLRKMVVHRIADPVILRLVGKWLRAGVMQDGVVVRNREGVSQGNPISPVLANLYLHHVLDLWFERRFKRGCRGAAHLIRFVDDFVVCLEHQAEADAFGPELAERRQKFGLELKPEKTRLLLFGRSAEGGPPHTERSQARSYSWASSMCVVWTGGASSPWCAFPRTTVAGSFWIASTTGSRVICTGTAGPNRLI